VFDSLGLSGVGRMRPITSHRANLMAPATIHS
jgi:hypothetical protein